MKANEILTRAANLVAGDRERTHGDKVENFRNTAALFSAYLGIDITPVQAAMLVALLKIARTKAGAHNLDDYVDLAGYAGVAGEIAERLEANNGD